jgi:hypothetical protein
MRRILGLLVIGMSVVGCAASAPGGGVAAPSSAGATAETTPSGSQPTLDAAASAYSAVAGPYNDAIDRAEESYGTRSALEDHQRYWALIAQADQAFLEGLRKIAFPPEIRDAAAVLIRADEAFQERAVLASRARNLAEVRSLSAVANEAADVVAQKAAIVRAALGLGPST